MVTEMALTMYSLMASEVAAIKQPQYHKFGIKFMKMAKVWRCHEFYENIRIFMKLAWILWIWHKVYEDGKSMRMSWILWKCQNFYEAGANFMNAAHQADQAIFRRPQRSNGLGSRSKPVNFVAGLEANNLRKFHPDRPSRLGGVPGHT